MEGRSVENSNIELKSFVEGRDNRTVFSIIKLSFFITTHQFCQTGGLTYFN